MLYHHHLPHLYSGQCPVFLTWRLHGTLPRSCAFPAGALPSGQAFAGMDRLLDKAVSGPQYLRDDGLAAMIAQAIRGGGGERRLFVPHAYVVMPNHVHLLASPLRPLPEVTKWLKGATARRANAALGRSGLPFWQEESYDHLARDERDFSRIWGYIEENPVRAGIVRTAEEYRWSSAWTG